MLLLTFLGYAVLVYSLFQMDTRAEKPDDWKWGLGMFGGLLLMIFSVLLWAVPGFFSG